MKVRTVIWFLTLSGLLISCTDDDNAEPNALLEKGTVLYFPGPDNCNDYVIKTDDNFLYKPDILRSDFQQDSLLIEFTFESTENFHNWGFGGPIPIIVLHEIRKR